MLNKRFWQVSHKNAKNGKNIKNAKQEVNTH